MAERKRTNNDLQSIDIKLKNLKNTFYQNVLFTILPGINIIKHKMIA
jgi:hypothetical protein